jgi:hypothetical protein
MDDQFHIILTLQSTNEKFVGSSGIWNLNLSVKLSSYIIYGRNSNTVIVSNITPQRPRV